MAAIIIDSNELVWKATRDPGVSWKVLRYDRETGRSAVLLKFEPGAAAGEHLHPCGEEYFVLSGSLCDGDSTWGAGSYICHAPGSVHRPVSPDGCEILVWLDRPVDFL